MISKSPAAGLFCRLFGTNDIHTHIRLRPILKFIKKILGESGEVVTDIVELGCGNGINAFEFLKISKRTRSAICYTGIDSDENSIAKASSLRPRVEKGDMLAFYHGDAADFLENVVDSAADIVLLSDIVEHVDNPIKMLGEALRCLKDGGLFVVSVPTPLYPRIFGRRFHYRIGHVLDGYTLESLDSLFVDNFGCARVSFKYNTGLVSNLGCWLYYNLLGSSNRIFAYAKYLILSPFVLLDLYNSHYVSCTLFAVYKKGPDGQ
jgi:SAM-dependent methyltransferase